MSLFLISKHWLWDSHKQLLKMKACVKVWPYQGYLTSLPSCSRHSIKITRQSWRTCLNYTLIKKAVHIWTAFSILFLPSFLQPYGSWFNSSDNLSDNWMTNTSLAEKWTKSIWWMFWLFLSINQTGLTTLRGGQSADISIVIIFN